MGREKGTMENNERKGRRREIGGFGFRPTDDFVMIISQLTLILAAVCLIHSFFDSYKPSAIAQ